MSFRAPSTLAKTLYWALALSLLLHVVLLVAPGLHLPGTGDLPQTDSIDAQISARPSQPAAIPQPQPEKQVTSRAPPQQRIETGPQNVGAATTNETSAYSPAAAPESKPSIKEVQVAVAEPSLPRSGRLRFLVTRGEQNFVIGEAIHTWQYERGNYRLKSTAQTVGLAALFRPAKIVQISEGKIDASGLKPDLFRNEKGGSAETANFDWKANQLTQSKASGTQALVPGTQDLLSMFYQLSLLPLQGKTLEVWVATGKKFERYTFEIMGEEKLKLKLGELRTLHLRTHSSGTDSTEIWLALDYAHLPVKIRYIDKKNEIYDQLAEDIEFERNKL